MQPTSDDYFNALGKLAFAASHLEEAMVVFTAALTETTNPEELDAELRSDTWAKNTKKLRNLLSERVGDYYRPRLVALLDQSDTLRRLRNENVHALWQVMENADTGEFSHVLRARVTVDRRSRTTSTEVGPADLSEIENLARNMADLSRKLQTEFKHVWDMDETLRTWRETQGL
ncbi:hypothetical protein ACQR16_24480 [Bradyrhizobium oligotrophicum]|uniref:hypothetical protein n=1 Tax=Bradyrhizobium oligotrophicum TaxID=44255 RepID=UPI003EBC3C52